MEGFTNTEDLYAITKKIDQVSINSEEQELSASDVAKLRIENAELKKEMQAMESKLKSNMKSIKTFWSPELKKEKAARIEQSDRFLALQEQYTNLSKEAQELQNLLETEKGKVRELQNGDIAVDEVESTFNNQETVGILLERIKELENESLDLQQQVDAKEIEIVKLEDQIENVAAEKEMSQMQNLLDALSKVTHLEEDIAARDEAISTLESELEITKAQATLAFELQEVITLKDSELQKISEQCNTLTDESKEAKEASFKNLIDEETKYKEELKKKEEVFESHSKFIKSKVESLKGELAKKDTELAAAETKVETFKKHQSDLQEHISVLHSSNNSKETHIQNLQQEIRSVRSRLEEKEKLLSDKEKEVSSLSSLQSRNSGEVDVLNTLIQSKEKQVASLKEKCVNLENELTEKTQLLSNSKNNAASIEAECDDVRSNLKTLQKTVRDKELKIGNLEQKNENLIAEHEQETQNLQRQLSASQTKVLAKEVMLQDKEEELSKIKSHNVQEGNRAFTLEKSIRDRESVLDELKMEVNKKNEEIKRLKLSVSSGEDDLEKVKKECKRLNDDLAELEKSNNNLKNEITYKNEKLEDVEKQLREQTKKITNMKRNQQLERERHATTLNDLKQHLSENDNSQSEIKNELEAKIERISILEEALQETVNSVSENEKLLGEQTNKNYELEVELTNLKIENTVTNTKNASLILSLSERDIALAYYRHERKCMTTEVLEMKQNALLATISEKDTNVAILEQNPTAKSDQEVRKLKAEKDHLVDQLKQLNQKRVLILSDDSNMTISTELSQGTKETLLETLLILESNAEKLLFYMNNLADVMKEHYKDIYKSLPRSPSPRESKLSCEEASHSEVAKEVECQVHYVQSLHDYTEVMLESLEETDHDHEEHNIEEGHRK